MGAEKELRTRSRKCSHTVTAALDLYLGLNPGPRFLSLLLCATPKGTLDAANCLKWEQLCAQPSLDRALCAFAAGGEGSLPLSFQNVPLEWDKVSWARASTAPFAFQGNPGPARGGDSAVTCNGSPWKNPEPQLVHPIPSQLSAQRLLPRLCQDGSVAPLRQIQSLGCDGSCSWSCSWSCSGAVPGAVLELCPSSARSSSPGNSRV